MNGMYIYLINCYVQIPQVKKSYLGNFDGANWGKLDNVRTVMKCMKMFRLVLFRLCVGCLEWWEIDCSGMLGKSKAEQDQFRCTVCE